MEKVNEQDEEEKKEEEPEAVAAIILDENVNSFAVKFGNPDINKIPSIAARKDSNTIEEVEAESEADEASCKVSGGVGEVNPAQMSPDSKWQKLYSMPAIVVQ